MGRVMRRQRSVVERSPRRSSETGAIGHYLRQLGPDGPETVAIYTTRPESERGNSYLGGTQLQGPLHAQYNIQPSVDCANVPGGSFKRAEEPTTDSPTDPNAKGPSCWLQPLPGASGPTSIPHVGFKDYLKSTPPTPAK